MAEWWDLDGQRREAEQKIKDAADQAYKQSIANVQSIDYNPMHGEAAGNINQLTKGTGFDIDPMNSTLGGAFNQGHNMQNQETNRLTHRLGFGETTKGNANLPTTPPANVAPVVSPSSSTSVGPDWEKNMAAWKSSQGLEGKLRDSLRAGTPKNVQFTSNLEKNPFGGK